MKNTQNYYVYKVDSKETTCTRCLNNHDRIFLEEDVPLLPVHPNCRCEANILRDIKINDSYIEALEYREFFANDDKVLPDERGRYWMRTYTNKANSWLVYSNDGLIFYTYDNGKTFYPCYVSEDFISNLDDTKLIYPSKDYETKYQEILDKFPPYLYDSDWELDKKINTLKDIVEELNIDYIREWKLIDAGFHGIDEIKNKFFKTDNHITKNVYCKEWITAYKEVIKIASEICEIPPVLLAGVAWIEVGGDPAFVDHAAYLIRGEDEEILTSFGDLSMQVRRIAEVVREDINDLTKREKKLLIDISEDPQIQIFLVAQHLSDLKNVDFPDKSIDELTIDDIIVIANRYSIGPDHDIGRATIQDYGYRVVNAMEMLLELLE